jgi:hypothetical protein
MRLAVACSIFVALAGCGDVAQNSPAGADQSPDAQSTDVTAQSVAPTTVAVPATSHISDQSRTPLTNPAVTTITTTPPPSLDEMAIATPDRVQPGDRVTITPGSAIAHNCTDIVAVYDFDDVILGQLLSDGRWEPVVSVDVPPTWPACVGITTDASFAITVPPLPDGGYRLCLSVTVHFAGCASVFIAASELPDSAPPVEIGDVNGSDADTLEGPQLEPGESELFELGTHCGVGILSSSFNGQWWRTAEAPEEGDWIPAEWSSPTSPSGLVVELLLSADGDTLTATYNGRPVVYTPTELRTSDLCA